MYIIGKMFQNGLSMQFTRAPANLNALPFSPPFVNQIIEKKYSTLTIQPTKKTRNWSNIDLICWVKLSYESLLHV